MFTARKDLSCMNHLVELQDFLLTIDIIKIRTYTHSNKLIEIFKSDD